MNTETFTNKMTALFPHLSNADAQGNTLGSTAELWKGVSDKYVDDVKTILAPIASQILDVQPDLAVRNPDACPVVQVEVIESVGDAIVDGTDWDVSAIENKYVDVKLHRISRPFMLTAYDIMHGERVESKVGAAMSAVAKGVMAQFISAVSTATNSALPEGGITPETAAEISGVFGDKANCDTLILNPVQYANLVPTNAWGLNPDTEGVYGIGKIYKGYTGEKAAIAFSKDGVAGAVATPEILFNQQGQGAQYLGEIGGIPMILISTFDYKKQAVKCSVETFAGFAMTSTNRVHTYTA